MFHEKQFPKISKIKSVKKKKKLQSLQEKSQISKCKRHKFMWFLDEKKPTYFYKVCFL